MRVLATYSIKGGVGKTATAVNLAYLAARSGVSTLLWDLDPQGSATWLFRVKAKVKGGGRALVRGRRDADGAIKGTDFEGLDLLPADFSYRNLDLDLDEAGKPRRRLARVLAPLAGQYDLVVLDCPPSISLASESIFAASDALLVPLVPTTLSVRTLDQLSAFVAGPFLKGPQADGPRAGPPARSPGTVAATGSGPLAPAAIPGSPGRPQVLAFFSMVDRRKRLHREVVDDLAGNRPQIATAVIPAMSAIEQMAELRLPTTASNPRARAAQSYAALWAELQRGF